MLIVDEALAVGDLNFQARCFAKLNELRAAGKTVLFVTHSLDTVLRACSRALVFEKGQLIADTSPKDAVDTYKQLLADCRDGAAGPRPAAGGGPGPVNPDARIYGQGQAEITACELLDEQGRPTRLLLHGRRFTIRMAVRFLADVPAPIFAFTIKDLRGFELTGTNTRFKGVPAGPYRRGDAVTVEFVQTLNAASGRYALSVGCTGYEGDSLVVYQRLYDIILFETASASPMVGCYDLDSAITVSPCPPAGR